jgi:hypothetical protein
MRRLAIAVASVALVAAPLSAQQHRVTITLARGARPLDATMEVAGQMIATKVEAGAWYDSVDVMLDALAGDPASRVVRMPLPLTPRTEYYAAVMAEPVFLHGTPSGATAFTVVVFAPNKFGRDWKFRTMGVGSAVGAKAASEDIMRMINSAVTSLVALGVR